MDKCLQCSINNVADKGRNYNIDLIRLIACAAVVGLHTMPKDYQISAAVLYYLCGFAVPFFFMASGFFLLNRGEIHAEYPVKKILGILKVVSCWNLLIAVLKLVKQIVFGKEILDWIFQTIIACIKSLVQKGMMWQFWYLGALMIIYALVPLISRFNRKRKYALLFIAGGISIVMESISILSGSAVQANIIQTFRIWTWIFYFVLGGEMIRIFKMIGTKISIKAHAVAVVGTTIINMIYQSYAGVHLIISNSGTRLHAEYFYDSFGEMIWVILLFSMLLRINIPGAAKKIIGAVSPLAMGIYIVHPILIKVVTKIVVNSSLAEAAMCWIIILISSTAAAYLISKTPLKFFLLKV